MKITHHFRGIYGIYPKLIKENQRMSTCDRLDLQTIGSQPIMPAQKSPQSLFGEVFGHKIIGRDPDGVSKSNGYMLQFLGFFFMKNKYIP